MLKTIFSNVSMQGVAVSQNSLLAAEVNQQ